MRHVTFDLETLGTSSKAPIVQLAAVEFSAGSEFLREFDMRIDLSGGYFEGYKADIGTLEWWMNQKDGPRLRVFDPAGRESLPEALKAFKKWLGADVYLWSHATFDPPILFNAYDTELTGEPPAAHRNFMDIRTLKLLAGKVETRERAYFGDHHDAAADCRYQAHYIRAMLLKVREKGLLDGNF